MSSLALKIKVAATRVAISSVCLLLPNVTLYYLQKAAFMRRNPRWRIPVELSVIAYAHLRGGGATYLWKSVANDCSNKMYSWGGSTHPQPLT